MDEPITCAGELEELVLALELEPLAAQQLAEVLEMIRSGEAQQLGVDAGGGGSSSGRHMLVVCHGGKRTRRVSLGRRP